LQKPKKINNLNGEKKEKEGKGGGGGGGGGSDFNIKRTGGASRTFFHVTPTKQDLVTV